jgi:translocation and assembly module TamB
MVRHLTRAARVAATTGLFVGTLAGGAVLHAGMPVLRRALVHRVDQALAATFAGQVEIRQLGGLGPMGAEGLDVDVVDPDGKTVASLRGVRARVSAVGTALSFLRGGEAAVDVTSVTATSADVDLDPAADGKPRIAHAFALRSPPTGQPGRAVRVVLGEVSIERLHVHGAPGGVPPLEADVSAVAGSLHFESGTLDVNVSHATVSGARLPGGLQASGTIAGHLNSPSPSGASLAVHATWDGTVGAVAETASATLDGADLEASLDVTRCTPEAVRSVWAACPFTAPLSLHADARGTLPRLAFHLGGAVGAGDLKADGSVTVGAGVTATAHLVASKVDLHAIADAAPPSELTATGDASVSASSAGALSGDVKLSIAEGTVGGVATPAATAHVKGAFDPSQPGSAAATAALTLSETGAPTTMTFRLAPKGSSLGLTFEGRAVVPHLDAAPRLGRIASGQAALAVEGSLDLGTGRLDAEAQASADELRAGVGLLHHATFVVHAAGPVGAPRFDATLDGDEVEIGPLRFQKVQGRSQGSAAAAPVEVWLHGAKSEVHGQAQVTFLPRPTLRSLVVTLDRDGQRVEARADLVSVGGGETRVDDLEVDGLGAPMHAALRQSPGALYLRAHSRRLDLGHICALLGIEDARGRVALDVDALLRANGAQGRVQVDLHDVTLGQVSGLQAHLGATLEGRHVSGTATAEVADIGSIDVHTTSLEIGGSDSPSWDYWKRAWGAADATAHVDLAKLAARLPGRTLPLGARTGSIDLEAHVDRDSLSDATPGVDVVAHTKGLVLGGEAASGPWEVAGLDAKVRVKVDGDSGHTDLQFLLADPLGPLAELTASSDGVPYGALFAGQDPYDVFRGTPFEAELSLPSRDIGTLPAVLGTRGEHGILQASVHWNGAPERPTIDLTGSLRKGQTDVRLLALPVDFDVSGHYDGARADASLQASGRGRKLLDASVGVDTRAGDLLQWARGATLAWKASARAKLLGFPLQSVGALDDRGLRGKVSGDFTLDGLNDDARLGFSATIDGLKVGDLAYKGSSYTLWVDGKGADGRVRIDQEDGFVEAHGQLGTHWGSALLPSIDPSKPIDIVLAAKDYRLGLLGPFVASVVSELDGRVNANARLRIDPRTQTVLPQGTISLQDGNFELTSLGGTFHDVTGKVTMTPDGVVTIEDVSARGTSGRLEAAATARIDARGLLGLRGQIQVPQKEQLPVVFDDVQVGTFYGGLSVAADRTPDGRRLAVNVGVSSLHVALPLAAGHEVQNLGGIEGLRMGHGGPGSAKVAAKDEQRATEGSGGMPVDVTIDLGKDTEVKRGTSLDVVLEGRPTVSLSDGVRAGGQIRMTRGSIDVQGKEFTLDSGTVNFIGDDPTNPQVALTARWPAPDGTIIYADFLGPLKTGQVTLRSEPAKSKNEIIALILFGTTDDATAAPSDSGTQGLNVVGGAAGAAATQPINRVLDSFGLAGGVSTKIDTSGTTPRPEVEVQIAKDITLQVAWVLGVPPPGSNPDSTLVTLNWRFLRKWSLATTVGDAGTSILDLIWQHRY